MTKAEKTRQFIIEKTAPVFNVKGYSGTSMSDLTEVTGLTKGSIYGNFANKDEVALAAFEHNLQQVTNYIKSELQQQTTQRGKLKVYPKVYRGFLQHPFPVGGCPILNTAIEADDTHPALKQKACNALLVWKKSLAHTITKGIENGEFDKYTDAEQVAVTLMAQIEGGIMIAKLTGKMDYFKKVIEQTEQLIDNL